MNVYEFAGILGTVFSIATFLVPDNWKSKRITLMLFVLVTGSLCSIITNQSDKLDRIRKVSRAATELSSKREMHFTHQGYIQAGLAFLEQNKDLYPDSYNRAKIIYEKYNKESMEALEQARKEPAPLAESIWDFVYADNENADWRKF